MRRVYDFPPRMPPAALKRPNRGEKGQIEADDAYGKPG